MSEWRAERCACLHRASHSATRSHSTGARAARRKGKRLVDIPWYVITLREIRGGTHGPWSTADDTEKRRETGKNADPRRGQGQGGWEVRINNELYRVMCCIRLYVGEFLGSYMGPTLESRVPGPLGRRGVLVWAGFGRSIMLCLC